MKKLLIICLLLTTVSYAQSDDEPYDEYEEDIETVDTDLDDYDDSPYERGNGHGSGSDCPPHSECWCAENPNRCKYLPSAPVMPVGVMVLLVVSGLGFVYKFLKS